MIKRYSSRESKRWKLSRKARRVRFVWISEKNGSMKRFTNFAMLALCGILFGAPTANAADAQPVGTFNDWRAYVEGSGQTKLCYIVGEPRRKLPRAARRGDVFLTVSHRPGAGVRNEVSVRIGYPFSADSNPFARIGSDTFAFFTGVRANTNAKEWAWVDNEARQGALVNAMKRGNELVFKGTSERGTLTTDSYSLKGVTAAMEAIDKACSDG